MVDIIVTGGRDYQDLFKLCSTLNLFDIGLIIQGGASGADRMAGCYALDNDIELITVKADWGKHGLAAGPIRNREMLDRYPNAVVIAFPGGKGTADCVRAAINKKMTVLEVK